MLYYAENEPLMQHYQHSYANLAKLSTFHDDSQIQDGIFDGEKRVSQDGDSHYKITYADLNILRPVMD